MIEMLTGATVTDEVAIMEPSLVAVALTVADPGVAGAVQTVVAPLAVCAGLNVPQGEGVHVQSTPRFRKSFVTVAAMDEF